MVRLKVYKKSDVPRKPPLLVALQPQTGGGVNVILVDKTGQTVNHLLCLGSDGTIYRYKSVSAEFGFQLDSAGRIMIREKG